jgi:hypothetical protein
MRFTLRALDDTYIIIDTILDRSSGWRDTLTLAEQAFRTSNRMYSANWSIPTTSSYDHFCKKFAECGFTLLEYVSDEPLAYEFW